MFKLSALVLIFLFSINYAEAARVYLLNDDQEALQSRVDYIKHAKEEILLETFETGDTPFTLSFMSLLLKKAQEGVPVKVILDAMHTEIPEAFMYLLLQNGKDVNGEQKLEIKLYNHFKLFDVLNYTHRDHAKLLIIDNENLFIGGRNLKPAYYGLEKKKNYVDLDVLTEGLPANKARESFYEVWNSDLVANPKVKKYTEESLTKDCGTDRQQRSTCIALKSQHKKELKINTAKFETIIAGLENFATPSPQKIDWLEQGSDFKSTIFKSHEETEFVSPQSGYLTEYILNRIIKTKKELLIANPYLIPTDDEMNLFEYLIKDRKIKIKIVTNSQKTNNQALAHIGYAKKRKKLIELGVELYEFKGPETLHAKVLIIDSRKIVIGSFNFDPRSSYINREVALKLRDKDPNNKVVLQTRQFFNDLKERSVLVGINGEEINKELWNKKMGFGKRLQYNFKKIFYPLYKNQL